MEEEEFNKIFNEAMRELSNHDSSRSIIVRTGRLGAIGFIKRCNEQLGITEPIDESRFPEGSYIIDEYGLMYTG